MFPNNWFLSKNGAKRSIYSDHSISYRTNYSSIPNPKKAPFRMEAKLILTIGTWLGITSYIGAIWLNIGTWKSDILVVFGGAFMLLKFIRLTMKTWYEWKREEIEIKILQKKSEDIEE